MNAPASAAIAPAEKRKKRFFCSFCAKSEFEVRIMVAGPDCAICDECVDLCCEIIYHNDDPGRIEYESWAQHLTPNVAIKREP